MIASLPMYATPRTAGATARLWSLIRDALRRGGIGAPERLALDVPDLRAHWLAPDLVLSQTCGLPYRLWLADAVGLVGTPDYGLKGCAPGHYHSVIVARSDDTRPELGAFRGASFALNDPNSQSGWAALATMAPEVLNGAKRVTGSHLASLKAVRDGRADFAAIDAVTWRVLGADRRTAGLRVVDATPPTPGLPLITARTNDSRAIAAAVEDAIERLSNADRAKLGLHGIVHLPPAAYLGLPTPPRPENLLTA